MYRHILIPTDGSDLSKEAIEHGIALAKALNAKVTVVTVTTPFHAISVKSGMIMDTPEQYQRRITAVAMKYLDAAKDVAATSNVTCNVAHVEHDQPYKAIIDTVEKRGCDAIVMASHGRRGVSAIVLGSETVKVLTHSAVPVVVYRAQSPTAFFAAS